MSGQPPPHARRSLTETVREALAERIANEAIGPGDRLPTERLLMAEFGVSRTVVRDAIARLRAEGLVDSRQGSGVFVRQPPPPSPTETMRALAAIVETLEVRAAFEIEAARLAAQRASPAQATEIGLCCEEMRDAPTADAAEAADLAFHKAIAAATNNSRFVQLFDFLGARTIPRAQLRKLRLAPAPPPGYGALILGEHQEIRDAIRAGDADAAGDAMRRHLRTSQDRYVGLIRATGG